MTKLSFEEVAKLKAKGNKTKGIRNKVVYNFIKKRFEEGINEFSMDFKSLKQEVKSNISENKCYYRRFFKLTIEENNLDPNINFIVDTINYRGRVYFKISKK